MAGAGDFAALLALDGLARRQGAGGLHPRLRQVVEAAGRFPAHSSGPAAEAPADAGDWPAQVVPLCRPRMQDERRRA